MIRQTFSENGDNEQSEPTTENNINNNTNNNHPRKGEDKSKTSSVELVTASFPNQTDQSKRMKNQSQDRRSEFNNSQEQSSLLSSYQQTNGNNIPRSSQKVASRLRSTTETRATAILGQQDNTLLSQSGASSAQSKQYPKNRLSYEVASEENGQLTQSQPRQSKLNRQIQSKEDIDLQSGQIHLVDGQEGSVFQSQSRQGQKGRQSQQIQRQYERRQSGLAEQKDKQKVRSISEQQSNLQSNNNKNNSNRQSLQLQDIPRKQENRQHQEWIEPRDNNLLGQQEGRSNFKPNNNNNNTYKSQQFEDTLPMEVKGLRTKERPMLTIGQSAEKHPYEDASSPTRSVAQVSSQLSSPKVQFGTPTAPILQARSMALQLRNTLSSQGSNHSDLANKLSSKKPKNVNEEEEQKEGNEENSQNIARPISEKELEERIKRGLQLRQELAAEMDPQETWSYFEKYQPISHGIIDMKQLASSEFLRLKRYKQGYFYGDIQNLTKTGQGIMAYFTGKLYEGEWQNDTKFGKGFELQPNGSSYQGYFVNGKPEGYGEYIWNNGESYQGDWVNGLKHGQGTWLGQKGDSYSGEWKFGKADGKGKHTWVNGDVYEGDFKCCLKHGQGEERFANNDTYIGQYANGRPEGQGIYNWSQGAIYKGGFKNGLRHGKGMWMKNKEDEESDSYEGDYLNDKRCGQGVFHWASGNVYKGEYFDDLRNGYGEMFWTDGSYYKGDWEKGVQCGEGELHIVGEGVKKGLFANNSLLVPASSSAAPPEINSTKQQYRPEVFSRIMPNVEPREHQKLNQRSLPPMYQQRLLQEPRSLEQLPSEEDQIDEQHLLAGQPVAQQQQAAYLPTYQSQEVQPKQWAQQSQQTYQEQQNDGRYQTNEMPELDNHEQQQPQQQNPQFLLAEQLQRKYQEEQQLRQRAEMQLEQELFLQRELQGLRQQQEKLNEQQLKQEQQLSRLLPRLQSRSSSSDTQSLLQSRNIFQNSTNKTRQPLSTQQDDYCQTSLTPPSTQTQTDPRQQDNNNSNTSNNIDEQALQQYQKQQEQLQEQQLQQLLQLQQQQQQQYESQQMPYIANKRHSSVEKDRESKGTQTVLTQDRSVSTESQMKPKRENKGLVLPRLVPLSTKRSQQSGHHRHRNNNNNSNSVSPNRERDRDGSRSPAGLGFDSNKPCLLKHQEIILWQSMRNKLGIPARELNDFSDPKTVEIIRAKIHPPIWKPTGVARFLEESPSKQILLSAVASGLNNAGGGQLNTKST